MIRTTLFAIAAMSLLGAAAGAETTLKLATIAPEGSSWMNLMRAGGDEIRDRTSGRVIIKFYGGGVMGNDRKVLRKMRAGQLQGGAFTASALAERYPGINLYGLPLLFRSIDEVDHVRAKIDSRLIAGMHEAGLVSFGLAGGGFAQLMSSQPVDHLDDLRGRKIWVPEGDRISYAAMEALGLAPVTLPLTDVLTGLQTGLIDIVASSPVGALILQWHTKVRFVSELPVAYTMATLVLERDAFEKLTAPDQAVVREVMSRIYSELDQMNRAENGNALAALKSSGLEFIPPDASQVPLWREQVAQANQRMGEQGAFDLGLFREVTTLLDQYRNRAAAAQ